MMTAALLMLLVVVLGFGLVRVLEKRLVAL